MNYFIIGYLFVINALSFLLMHGDKQKARRKKWRIPEKTLLTVCAMGGSLGGLLGMRLFRHKTRHRAFAWGIPAMLAGHLVLLYLLIQLLY